MIKFTMSEVGESGIQGTMSQVGENGILLCQKWDSASCVRSGIQLCQKWERQWDSAVSQVGESGIQLYHKWERQCDSGNYVTSRRYSVIQVTTSQVGFR